MDHTLALSHVLSAGIAFVFIGSVAAVRAHRSQRKRRQHSSRHLVRRSALGCLHLLVRLLWAILCLMGRPIANKRYAALASHIGPFETLLAAGNHRLGHAACMPIPLAPCWVLRCRACRAWVLLREVPAHGGAGLDLQMVRGSLDVTRPCPARFLSQLNAPSAAHTASSTRPPSVP